MKINPATLRVGNGERTKSQLTRNDYDDDVSVSDDDSLEKGDASSSSSYNEGDPSTTEGTSTSNSSTDQAEKEIAKLVHRESKDVYMWREIVTGMMLVTAALLTVGTYILLTRNQYDNFAQGFNETADLVANAIDYKMRTLQEGFSATSDFVTTLSVNATWPNVTIPNFDTHCSHLRILTQVPTVWFAPIVTESERTGWEAYSQIQAPPSSLPINPTIFTFVNGTVEPAPNPGPFLPIWEMSPTPDGTAEGLDMSPINFDLLSDPSIYEQAAQVEENNIASISGFLQGPLLVSLSAKYTTSSVNESLGSPMSLFLEPIFNVHRDNVGRATVAYLQAILDWKVYLSNILLENEVIYLVLGNSCNQSSSWVISGKQASFEGEGDLDTTQYKDLMVSYQIGSDGNEEAISAQERLLAVGVCTYFINVYPTSQFRESYNSNFPAIYTSVVAAVFFVVAVTFFLYDRYVQRRNQKILRTAARSNAIVSSMFPAKIRNQMLGEGRAGKSNRMSHAKAGLKTFLHDGLLDENDDDEDDDVFLASAKPIADLFPETTIMFADLAGFTAWSSTREPSQVFTLLETVYHAFDVIARKRRIFKVETVGDCYVAVAGLPEARKDHAIAMAKFAHDCLKRMNDLTRKLEVSLGPDTADLTIRVGLHSGPVTAGVLRGERSRFQLFGDTMNTAARMESTGMKGKIQLSQETADLLTSSGKGHWLKERPEKVHAKGKGELATFWLHVSDKGAGSSTTDSSSNAGDAQEPYHVRNLELDAMGDEKSTSHALRLLSEKTVRLIGWNVDLLLRSVKQIVARRQAGQASRLGYNKPSSNFEPRAGMQPLEEIQEIIALPEFDAEAARLQKEPDSIVLDDCVVEQLHDYVTNIAALYRDNAFHNFEHASHVTQSVSKLLSRIIAPSDLLDKFETFKGEQRELYSSLHDHTYGITSDPLTQFACCFSALIHDVDHTGVPNMQLVKENSKIAAIYKNKSVAEQNSIDLAWSLLMDEGYEDLRAAICATEAEQKRFRQLVVNSVMATDIMDKDLKVLRNARWDKAFNGEHVDKNALDRTNRKATIVIEHLIQASDVAHTMQHWHIYRKWNERFFEECYCAFQSGRAEKDPSEGWYQGEIGFFDFYIIPLARKLKDCGVFGVSSDEYLNYALNNRKEWEAKGREIVESMMENISAKQPKNK